MLRFLRAPKIPRILIQQSLLRARRLLAFLRDRNRDVIPVRFEFQNNLHCRNPVLRAIANRLFARGKTFRLRGPGRPLRQGFEVKMGQTVLDQDFHEPIYPI